MLQATKLPSEVVALCPQPLRLSQARRHVTTRPGPRLLCGGSVRSVGPSVCARKEASVANVTLVEKPKGLVRRFAFRYTRRAFGHVVEPTAAAANHGGVLAGWGAMEMIASRSWNRFDPTLRGLVIHLTSTRIGCPWCIDYGYFETVQQGVDPKKLRNVTRWRESELFDDRERVALEYAETATGSPAEVPTELARRLHAHFDEAQIVELAAWVALENYRSRFNAGLGLKSEGYSDKCEIGTVARQNAGQSS